MTNISIKQTTPHISIKASGKQGIQGEKGDTGATGAQGPKGDPGTTDYNELENLPDLTLKADKANTYTKTEVDTALTGKANTVHTHDASDITDFNTVVSNNSDVSANTTARHTHANKTVLDATTASYTTADETKLDGIEAGAQVNTVASVAGKTGAVTLSKTDVGLSNVDNTSDLNKPISAAAQESLDTKVQIANDLIGSPNSPVTPFAYRQSNKTQPYTSQTVISNFQSGHGFVLNSSNGSQSDDTTAWVRGTQSLKLTTNGATNPTFSRKTGLSLNITNKHFRLWLKTDQPTRISELYVYFSSDNVTANWITIKPSDDVTVLKPNVWTQLTFTQGRNAQTTGTPTLSAINSVQVRVRDNGTGVVNVWFGGLTSFNQPAQGVVSITFDDNYASVYNNARPTMDMYGYSGTMYTIPMRVGLANYMTIQQLKDIHGVGWDISNHTYDHINLTTLTPEQVEYQAYKSKQWFIQNSFTRGLDDLALPNGGYDDATVLPILKKYFRSVRTITNQVETVVPGDIYKLRTLYVINTTTLSTIQAAINSAVANKEWLILVFHDIPTGSATQDIQYTAANFATVMGYINSSGVAVKPVSEVLDNGTY